MFELINRKIIGNELENMQEVFREILKEKATNSSGQEQDVRNYILNLIMSALLCRFEVDGIWIKKNGKKIRNYIGEAYKNINRWKVEKIDTMKLDDISITFYKYYINKNNIRKKADYLKEIQKFKDLFSILLNFVPDSAIPISENGKKLDVLLGYVFHLYDFVIESTPSRLQNKSQKKIKLKPKDKLKLKEEYKNDQRFRLFESIFRNIKETMKDEIRRANLKNKINVHFAFGHAKGSGTYFFFPETFEKFSDIDELKMMINNPTEILKAGIGLLAKMNKPQRYGPLWAIFSDNEFPRYLNYIDKRKDLWEIEKKVFFANQSKAKDKVYFMGAIPFILFEEMYSYLYLVGTIGSENDFTKLRKSIGFLTLSLFTVSESTKSSLEIMKDESEKATLKKHLISYDLQGDRLLNLVKTERGYCEGYDKYIKSLINSYKQE